MLRIQVSLDSFCGRRDYCGVSNGSQCVFCFFFTRSLVGGPMLLLALCVAIVDGFASRAGLEGLGLVAKGVLLLADHAVSVHLVEEFATFFLDFLF